LERIVHGGTVRPAGVAALAGEWVLAGVQGVKNDIGGGKFLAEIHARRIEVARVGAFEEGQGVFGGGEPWRVRRGPGRIRRWRARLSSEPWRGGRVSVGRARRGGRCGWGGSFPTLRPRGAA